MDKVVLRGSYIMKLANNYVKIGNPSIKIDKNGTRVEGFQITPAGLYKEVSYQSEKSVELVKD